MYMIPQSTVDRIISTANIVEIVSGYVSLKRSGANYKGLCPFHDDTTPSFYVSPARGICKCFSCGEGGNVVHFIMKKEQLTYYEALKFLAKKYGIEVEERELTDEEKQTQSERESMFAVNEWVSGHFHDTLLNTNEGKAIGLAYFRNRGFRDDIIEKFRLGYCLQKNDETAKSAIKAGFKEEFIVKTGVAFKREDGSLRDKYYGRVIFPWFGINGKITGFGGRVLDSRTKGVNQKYINSPESTIYHKANELYGLFQAKGSIAKVNNVIMVEGYTDVISMHQAGIENVVANSGTALSEQQIKLLRRYTNNITLIYDGDQAGIHAALRGTDMLLKGGMRVKILLLPDDDDPDSFAKKHNATELRQYIDDNQVDFITFKANLYREQSVKDPIRKADLIKDIVTSISVIPEEIDRSIYIHQCSELMNADEAVIQREVNRRRRDMREEYKRQEEIRKEKERQQETKQPDSSPDGLEEPANGNTESDQHDSKDNGNGVQHNKFEGIERLIMMIVVRYGNKLIETRTDNNNPNTIHLVEYVTEQLKVDNIAFHSPLYRTMLETASSAKDITKTLLNSPDVNISSETAELLSDRYEMSKNGNIPDESELCGEYIVHLMLDYKYAVINEMLNDILVKFTDPAITSDTKQATQLMQQQMVLSKIKRQIAKALGERIMG